MVVSRVRTPVALLLCLAVQVVSATTVHTLALFTGCAGTNVQTPSAAVVSHASMGQPGNLTTIFLCDEISNGASEAWPSCRLPAIVADVISPRDTGGHHHEAHPRNHDWLLLIGSNFIFNRTITPWDLGLESTDKGATVSSDSDVPLHSPKRQKSLDNHLADLFGTSRPPSPTLLHTPSARTFSSTPSSSSLFLNSSDSFILIRAQDLLHLVPNWLQHCITPLHPYRNEQQAVQVAFLSAAADLSLIVVDRNDKEYSQRITSEHTQPVLQPPAVWPEGAPDMSTNPSNSENNEMITRKTRFGIKLVWRGKKGQQSASSLDEGWANMWTAQHSIHWTEGTGWSQIVEERSLFIPLGFWIVVVAVFFGVAALFRDVFRTWEV